MSNIEDKLTEAGFALSIDEEGYEVMEAEQLRIKIKRFVNQGSSMVLFESGGVSLQDAPKVCLSRLSTGDCWFPIDDLQAHDNHSPGWDSQSDMEIYIERIKADVKGAAQKYDGPVQALD